MAVTSPKFKTNYDLICAGGGIMSATSALLTTLLKPDVDLLILKRLDEIAKESAVAWNNAGTGHFALRELNYCPEDLNKVDISKAIDLCNQFEISKQFWAFLVREGLFTDPKSFINLVKHHHWVQRKDNVAYLKERFETMKEHFMFESIEFTDEIEKIREWFPLIMENRTSSGVMGASRVDSGCEMNFGAVTAQLFAILERNLNTPVSSNMEVLDIDPDNTIEWFTEVKNTKTTEISYFHARYVFIGAGGSSVSLLKKVELEEKEAYVGFPVSGQWLVCKNEEIIQQHNAKGYSKAEPGDPPRATPHLDTRHINGKRELLFGPFASFSPKFLKEGAYLDLFTSVKFNNISPMLGAFLKKLPLLKHLIEQVAMSFDDRMGALRQFVKNAKNEGWEIIHAGQREQIIKKDDFTGGELPFGTEIISSKEGSITCVLDAAPRASTALYSMLQVLEKAFSKL